MSRRVLITGGAGFIGSHVADELLARGFHIRALDTLLPQVHGPDRRRPAYLDPGVELVTGDVRDRDTLRRALEGVDIVYHVYGPRQALSNPYTGVLAIFATRLLDGVPPHIFEDGLQRRDFVHARDVATACRLALEVDAAVDGVFNIGSGQAITIREIATRMARVLGRPIAPRMTGDYRVGDIRHCTADIGLARGVLGFQPRVELDVGLGELADWLATQNAIDHVDTMRAELEERGLAV